MLALLLGHTEDTPLPLLSVARQQEVDRVILELTELDTLIAAALRDSMAIEVGDLKVNYDAHIAHLRGEASNKLRLLSVLTGLPLLFDRYSGRDLSATGGNTQYSLRRLL